MLHVRNRVVKDMVAMSLMLLPTSIRRAFGKSRAGMGARPYRLLLAIALVQFFSLYLVPASALAIELDHFQRQLEAGQLTNTEASELQKFIEQNPSNARAHYLLGRFYSRYNFGEMAALEFRSALRINKMQPQVWVNLINEKYRHKKVGEAQQILEEAGFVKRKQTLQSPKFITTQRASLPLVFTNAQA